jgi:hypothetical protein
MTHRILMLIASALLPVCSHAQNRLFYIAIETGIDVFWTGKTDEDYIRASSGASTLYDDWDKNISGSLARGHLAVKIETFTKNNKWSLATGLRYNYLHSEISKNAGADYYYVLHQEIGTTTEYLRIREIQQRSSYLAVPLEIRLAPFHGKIFNIFFGVGGEVNLRVASDNKITFHDPSMNEFSNDVSARVGRPEVIYATGYGKVGVAIGRRDRSFSVALNVPVILPYDATTIADPLLGAGINIQIIKPLFRHL